MDKVPSIVCGGKNGECGCTEFDVHIYNYSILILRCSSCGANHRQANPPYPLKVRAVMIDKPKKDANINVSNVELINELNDKDRQIKELRKQLESHGKDS
jgi:hypothetical protein